MRYIRMLTDREGSPNHTHVYPYRAGNIYSGASDPRVSDDLIDGFIASGHAVEVDASGNPLGKAADKRATKNSNRPGAEPNVEADVETDVDPVEAHKTEQE